MSTFGVIPQQTISLNFPASAGDWTHDQAFLYTPSPSGGQKGHIHPMIYRGSEQAFYIIRQSGMQVPVISPTKVNTMLKGSTPPSTVLSTGRYQLLVHRVFMLILRWIFRPLVSLFTSSMVSPHISCTFHFPCLHSPQVLCSFNGEPWEIFPSPVTFSTKVFVV